MLERQDLIQVHSPDVAGMASSAASVDVDGAAAPAPETTDTILTCAGDFVVGEDQAARFALEAARRAPSRHSSPEHPND